MIGQQYSSSRNACIITFIGGLYDGQNGLYDHDNFDSINFCDSEKRKTWKYTKYKDKIYKLDDVYFWDENTIYK